MGCQHFIKSSKSKVRWSLSSAAGWMRHSKLVGKIWKENFRDMVNVFIFFNNSEMLAGDHFLKTRDN